MGNRTVKIFETKRLILRRMVLEDREFILRLLNEPSWIEFIGDRGVRSSEDAEHYIRSGPLAMYAQHGCGLYTVDLKQTRRVPIGICGLLVRETLTDPDLGFAFLPEYWQRGYAFEAAAATLEHGREDLGLDRILAITAPENRPSIRLLEKLGFCLEGRIRIGEDRNAEKVLLYRHELRTP